MKLNLGIIALYSFVLSACASAAHNYSPETEQFGVPAIGQASNASIGESLLTQGFRTKGLALEVIRTMDTHLYRVDPGHYVKIGSEGTKGFYQEGYVSQVLRTGKINKKPLADPASRISYDPSTRKLCVVAVSFSGGTCADGNAREVPYVTSNARNFQQTLYYNGRVGDRINIGYREFSGDLARPAFSNEVEYDLSISNEVSYKGARLRIESADNNSITYVVLTGFAS